MLAGSLSGLNQPSLNLTDYSEAGKLLLSLRKVFGVKTFCIDKLMNYDDLFWSVFMTYH